MLELLFDIKPETSQVRITIRLACMMNQKGCSVHYTDSSDSIFTSGLLKKGIGRVLFPDDLRWFAPDLTLLDYLLPERATIYQQHGIDYIFIATQKENEGLINGTTVLYLPPSAYKPLSKGAREADFIEKLEEIKEDCSQVVIIGLLEKEGGSPDEVEQIYRAIKRYSIANLEYQFIVLTNQGKVEEALFALPDNIAVYRPQDLQALLPLCNLALIAEDWNARTECTFAHVPALELSPRNIRGMTPQKLDRHIKSTLINRNYLIDKQIQLCNFYELENQQLDKLADRLIERMEQRRQRI